MAIAFTIFLLIAGLFYTILADVNVEWFWGTACHNDPMRGVYCYEDFISLSAHLDGIQPYYSHKFLAVGWITFIGILLVIPGTLAALAYRFTKRT